MGKKRHNRDKLYLSAWELKTEGCGKKDTQNIPVAKLPFNYCALSLQPFKNAVCTKEGTVFDIVNVVPFIKKYKRNPVTGEPLKFSGLIKLKFHKNNLGQFHDPISFKEFTDYTKIAAIATSGNVFAYQTID